MTSPPASALGTNSPAGELARDRPSDLSRVARGSAANLLGAVVSALCAFALAVVVTRGMDKAAAGIFFSVTSLFFVATSIGQLGTDAGLVYFLSRARKQGRQDLIDDYLKAALRPVLTTAVIMTLLMFVLAPQLGQLTNPHHGDQAATYLRVLAVFIVPSAAETVLLSATRGLGTMRANVVVEQIGRQCAQVLFVALAVFLAAGAGNVAVAWSWSVPYVIAGIAAAFWWRRLRTRFVRPGVAGGSPVGRPFWRFTAPRSLASVAQLLMQRIDIVLVGAIAGPVQAAIFTAATRFVVAGQFGRNAISLAVQPPLAEALAHRDKSAAHDLFRTSAAWLLGITWPLYLTFCIPGSALLAIFGEGYGSGARILLLVSLGMLVATACGDVDSVLIMSGRTSWSLTNMVVGLTVMIGLDLWLIPGHGGVGAAIGWGAAMAVKNTSALVQVWIAYRFNPFGRATLTMAALNLGCFAAVPLLLKLVPAPAWVTLLAGLAIGAAAYLAGLWVLRRPLELDQFRSMRRRRPATRRM